MTSHNDIRLDDLPPDYRSVAEAIGLAAALALVEARGGEALYVPKADKVARHARDRAIRAAFTGSNYRELARAHNLTVVMVRNIVGGRPTDDRNGGRADVDTQQRPLFRT